MTTMKSSSNLQQQSWYLKSINSNICIQVSPQPISKKYWLVEMKALKMCKNTSIKPPNKSVSPTNPWTSPSFKNQRPQKKRKIKSVKNRYLFQPPHLKWSNLKIWKILRIRNCHQSRRRMSWVGSRRLCSILKKY